MKSLNLNKKKIPYLLAVVVLLLHIFIFRDNGRMVEEVEVPVQENKKVIEAPVPQIRIDTVYLEAESGEAEVLLVEVVNPVNKELLSKYEEAVKLNDSLKLLQLYKEAVTERKYIEVLEDSVQVITVESEIIGILQRQTIEYKTKPMTLKVKTSKKKPSFYLGGYAYTPIAKAEAPVVGLNVQLLNKSKKKIFTFGYDTQKRLQFGVTFKLF